MRRYFVLMLTIACCFLRLQAQFNVAIGQWNAHLPYSGSMMLANSDDLIYCANESSVFTYNKQDHSLETLTTADGFSDIGIRMIAYDEPTRSLVISYTNSNIDFVLDNTIYNFPFIQNSNVSGDKNIYGATFYGDTILLSCGFGIVLFDISKLESPATYFFTDTSGANLRVNDAIVFQNNIYAATINGIYRGSLSEPNLQDFSKWDLLSDTDGIPPGDTHDIVENSGILFAALGDTIYSYTDDVWSTFYFEEEWHTRSLRSENGYVLITQQFGPDTLPPTNNRVLFVDGDLEVSDITSSTSLQHAEDAAYDANGTTWVADAYLGLLEIKDNVFVSHLPNGPSTSKVWDMLSINGTLYVAPGELNASWLYQFNRDGFFRYEYGSWVNFNNFSFPALDSTFDLITVAADVEKNIIYFGSYGGGLVEYHPDNMSMQIYKQGYIDYTPGDETKYRVSGLALDLNGNLWIANFGAVNPLVVKKSDGNWLHINPALPTAVSEQVGQIVVDPFNTKWVQLPRGNGILVYNENGTIDDTGDDLSKVLGSGAGNGNLHTNYVQCLAVDKEGEVWVGTSQGITIFYNPSEVFTNTTAGDAAQPLVNLGGYYEQLLRNDIVNTIAVDGANRKWVGTNSGAFLISPDGTEQLAYFNTDNSPLISNIVLNIEIDGITGDVYFGTDKGIISYRYTATEGVAEIDKVHVFPNPVREDYSGPIAINGLTENAEVRITDESGRTVYETTALGGQAVWDGNGYAGGRASTGIYIVYATNEDGSQTAVTKILFIQ
ncbi:MAG: two-component regulator propeller domain-containing protein [Chitinophagales bacterium]